MTKARIYRPAKTAMQYALVGGECLLKPVPRDGAFDFAAIRRDCYVPLARDARGRPQLHAPLAGHDCNWSHSGQRLLLALVVAIVKLVVGVLIIALFENSMARLRFCATSRVTWAGFGFAFLAFVSLLVA